MTAQYVSLREKCPNTELFLVRIFLYLDCRIQSEYRKIRTINNSVFGHFSRSVFLNQNCSNRERNYNSQDLLQPLCSIIQDHLFYYPAVIYRIFDQGSFRHSSLVPSLTKEDCSGCRVVPIIAVVGSRSHFHGPWSRFSGLL